MGVSTNGKFAKNFKDLKAGSHYPIPQAVTGFQAAFDGLNGIEFSHTGAKKATKVQYSLDNATWVDVPSDGHLTAVASGSRSLRLRGVNGVGQPGPETAAITVAVNPPPLDVTGFSVSKLGPGIMGYSFTPAIGSVRTEWSLDGGPWMPSYPGESFPGLSTGVHTLRLRGVNSAGVAGPETPTQMLRVYAVPTAATSITVTQLTGTSVKVVIGMPPNATTAEYSLDNGPWLPASLSTAIEAVSVGTHGVRIRGINQDGDIGAVAGPINFTIAPLPDQISDLRIADQTVSTFSLAFTTPSNTGSYQISYDGGPWTAWSISRFEGVAVGNHTIQVRALNRDGFPGPASNLLAFNMPTPVSPVTNFSVVSKQSLSFVINYTQPVEATGVQYRANNGAWTSVPANKTIVVPTTGVQTVQLRSILSGGTFGTASDYYTVTLVAAYSYSSYSYRSGNAGEFTTAGMAFGQFVATSSDGSTSVTHAINEGNGFIYVFDTSGLDPVRTARFGVPDDGYFFGAGMALSGDGNTLAAGSASNKFYIYTRSGSTWNLAQTITYPGTQIGLYQMSFSEDGNTLLAPYAGGKTKVFARSGGTFAAIGDINGYPADGSPLTLTSDGTACVAMENGNTVAVHSRTGGAFTKQSSFILPWYIGAITMSGNGLYFAVTSKDVYYTYIWSRPNISSTSWTQTTYYQYYSQIKTTGSGCSVSMTNDGSALLATTDSSTQANSAYGFSYILTRNGANWGLAIDTMDTGHYGYRGQMARKGGKWVIGADQSTVNGKTYAGRFISHTAGLL